jgi:hypothetical protein
MWPGSEGFHSPSTHLNISMLNLMIYQSMRNDWALALMGSGEPTVLAYRPTVDAAKDVAKGVFSQPLNWRPRTGQRVFEGDHPSVGEVQTTPSYVAYLFLPDERT